MSSAARDDALGRRRRRRVQRQPGVDATGAATTVDPATTGTVRGRVILDGTPPPATTVRLDGDKTCATFAPGARRATETYVVGADGGLANVFVHVTAGLDGRSFPVPQEPVVLDQQRCWYVPRVVGVRVGQPLHVRNSDPLLHNVRANSAVNEPFNQGQPVQGMHYSHTFSTAEVMVPMKCDVHAWMNAWIGVVNHPYFAVTGADGTFTLGEPAGGQLHGGSVARGGRHAVRHRDRAPRRARPRCPSPSRRPRHERRAHAHALGDDGGRRAGDRAVAVAGGGLRRAHQAAAQSAGGDDDAGGLLRRAAGRRAARRARPHGGRHDAGRGRRLGVESGLGEGHRQADAAHPAAAPARCPPRRGAGAVVRRRA